MTRGRPKYDDILTPREFDVLALIREGLTNQQIADRLEISANTAKYHVAAILAKLEVATREDAAAWRPEPERRSRFAGFAALVWPLRHLPSGFAGKAVAGAAAIATVGVFVFALGVLTQQDGSSGLGKIAYIQDGNLWVKTLPDGKPQQLTTDGNNSFPRWSSSGGWLSLTHGTYPDSEAWVIRADGSSRRRVESSGFGLEQWSPTEDELLYLRPDNTWWVEAADGKDPRVIATPYSSPTEAGQINLLRGHDGDFLYTEARWPADIAARGDFESALPPEWSSYILGRMDADGGARHELLRFAPPQSQIVPLGWTTNDSLLFATAPLEGGPPMLDGLPLHAVPMSGGPVLDLDATVVLGSAAAARPGNPTEFAVAAGGQRQSWTNKHIALVDASTGAVTRLTPEDIAANSPAWSPDGSQIAYVGSINAGADGRDASLASRRIWVMDVDGSDPRQLTTDGKYRDEAPIWSSDGAHILFFRLSLDTCNPSYRVMLLNVRDGSVEEVLRGLPPIATMNYGFEIGDVPECDQSTTQAAGVTDFLGRVNFGQVFAWWQPHDASIAPTGSPEASR